MEIIQPISSSFRDPNGFIFSHKGSFYRAVKNTYQNEYEHLMRSGLYKDLISKNLLIQHEEVELPVNKDSSFYKILFPEQIDFISYPYEWGFEQWKAVLLSFLKINQTALQYGMILQDATCFNFTFYKGKPFFFDTLSFVFYKEGQPWRAYRQFCESMLGPFALQKYKGANWSRFFATCINGLELPFISKQLPLKTWLQPVILLHIHLHAGYTDKQQKSTRTSTGMNSRKLRILMSHIFSTLEGWKLPRQKKGKWLDYYEETIVSKYYLTEKEKIVDSWLSKVQPTVLTDLGANNGRFSLIAAKYSSKVIAVESDGDCVNNLYAKIVKSGYVNIIPIQADLMQLSPSIGWANTERESLLKRLQAHTVLALALLHHLCIMNNLPLGFFAFFINSITTQYAIVEFIPKSDPMVENMLQYRKDIFPTYTESDFISCFEEYFTLLKTENSTSVNRTLYLWEKK